MDWGSVIGPKDKDDQQEEVTTSAESQPEVVNLDPVLPEYSVKSLNTLSKELENEKKIDLPPLKSLADYPDKDQRAPELIEGLLRMGHKCMVSAGSKAGKSFLAIELGLLIASGGVFIGHQCRQSSVLYVNLEIDEYSFIYRGREVYRALEINDPEVLENFKMLHLRGAALSLDNLAPALIEAIKRELVEHNRQFSTIILDPIYKISNGEENSARDVSRFCNQLDRISRETGCAIIYCHHHSKGDQGYKKAQDRASGSGVFARDADVIIDMVPLALDDKTKANIKNDMVCERLIDALNETGRSWGHLVPSDQLANTGVLSQALLDCGQTWEAVSNINKEVEAVFEKKLEDWVPMRVEYTVREFRTPKPQDIVFQYPVHYLDEKGLLAGAEPESHIQETIKEKTPSVNETRKMTLESVLSKLVMEKGFATYNELKDGTGVRDNRTLEKWISDLGIYEIKPGTGRTETTIRLRGS